MATSVIAALRALLLADATVNALSGGRVYGGELPQDQAASMPQGAVVLTPAGGGPNRSYDYLARDRVDVRAYGADPRASTILSWEVHRVLHRNPRKSAANTLVHSASLESGPFLMRDADAQWPMTFRSYIILSAEVAV